MNPALSYRAAPSLYSGMILALIVLAFLLQASFLAGLATGGASFGGPAAAAPFAHQAALPAAPCVNL